MLILSRKCGEAIHVGDTIVFRVLGFNSDQVRIGVSAPKEVAVHREEIYKLVKEEEAAGVRAQMPKIEVVRNE